MLFLLVIASFPVSAQDANPSATAAPARPVLFDNNDGISTSFATQPTLNQTPGGGGGGNTQWLKVELHYSVASGSDQIRFIPSVTFKIWIEGRDLYDPRGAPGEGIAVVLTGSVTYVNVPVGKDNYGSFYVNPNTLARYSTSTGYTDFDQKFDIHAEAYVGGKISDYFNKKKEQDLNWYTKPTAIAGLVYRQNQCAFMLDSPDKYPGIELEDKGGDSSSSSSATQPTGPVPAPAPAPAQ